jgi:hypothetical protein
VDAVSTFSDVEYSWDVHFGKSPYGCEKIHLRPNGAGAHKRRGFIEPTGDLNL